MSRRGFSLERRGAPRSVRGRRRVTAIDAHRIFETQCPATFPPRDLGVRAHQGNGRLRDCHLRADPSQLLPPGHVLLSGRPDHGVVVPTSVFGQHKERGAVGFPPVELARASVPSLQITRRMPDAIAISDAEANAFVCNAITVRNTVISPIGVSAATREALRKRGMSVVEVDMSEFMKSGGACQCLVLRL
ncbi:hypothetical protein Y032_0007g3234 [Ancylostoma ceylanicum]|uniref:Amidinotransferase n=1 Tax=Ancylostoma ceylanicum TaxID=53326 RepID=A0A016VLH7_9BILA|nr:hypothetical protein Y032_0007g3234 [Ancylostoma ceylanicum]